MSKYLLAGVLILWAVTTRAQQQLSRISALKTDAQVLELIRPLGWEYAQAALGDSVLAVYSPYARTRFSVRGGQTWLRADFDQNGRPDLLLLARLKDIPFVFCVLDMGNDSLRVVRNFYNAVQRRSPVARVVRQHGQDLLEYADFARSHGPRGQLRDRQEKLLAYVGGGFVEYNARPSQHRIQRVEYQGYSVYHQAVSTRIVVTNDSVHFWQHQVEMLDKSKVIVKQQSSCLLSERQQQLVSLLNYLNFSQLQDTYGKDPQNHHTRVTLKVEYDDGRHKVIEDLNGIGTTGLRRVYTLLFKLAQP